MGGNPLLDARYEYVKTSIINIKQFYSAWLKALETAIDHSSSSISPIINLIDEVERDKSGIFLNVFLTVLGVALSFIPVIGPALGLGLGSVVLVNSVIAAAQKAPLHYRLIPLTILFEDTLSSSLKQNFQDTLGIIQGLQQDNTSAFLASPDIGCSGHDEFGQYDQYYWWFSAEHKSMYTLVHDGKTEEKATEFIHTIFANDWSTGPLLFEKYYHIPWPPNTIANGVVSAAKCQFQNMLSVLKNQSYTYNISTLDGQAGYLYSASIPEVVEFEKQQDSGIFLPIPGSAFVALSKLAKVNAVQFHPVSSPFFRFDPANSNTGVDPACVSNLNVSIANSWKTDNWVGNNPE
ncbi:MAG: hypothetical protein Q9180_003570 [Flavoplaca navasiana]